MNNKFKVALVSVCAINLLSCSMVNDQDFYGYERYTYEQGATSMDGNYYVTDENGVRKYQTQDNQAKQQVEVPDSYHVGAFHAPVSFKDRDKKWVNSQNPLGYTIVLADGSQASAVAQTLSKAPKNNRMGQVKYNQGGSAHYKALYGSYESADAARKALSTLPDGIKQGAKVQNWGSVQSIVNK